jgi:hypothetical protein
VKVEDFVNLPDGLRAMIYNIRSEIIGGKIGQEAGERAIRNMVLNVSKMMDAPPEVKMDKDSVELISSRNGAREVVGRYKLSDVDKEAKEKRINPSLLCKHVFTNSYTCDKCGKTMQQLAQEATVEEDGEAGNNKPLNRSIEL